MRRRESARFVINITLKGDLVNEELGPYFHNCLKSRKYKRKGQFGLGHCGQITASELTAITIFMILKLKIFYQFDS